MNQEASSSNISSTPAGPWASPMENFKAREGGAHMMSDDRVFDMYGGFNGPFGHTGGGGEYLDYESQRAMNML